MGSGTIAWTEFLAAALCVSVSQKAKLVEAVFAEFDKDSDGQIDVRDIADIFAIGEVKSIWETHLIEEMKKIGTPGPDGKWSLAQFSKYMSQRMHVTHGDQLSAVK